MVSEQTLSEPDRRLLAGWAASCASRVLPLYDGDPEQRALLEDALSRARAFSAGEGTAAEEIRKRMVAVKAAGAAATPTGAAAGRSVGQAAAVAHVGAHALGAAAYAVRAACLAAGDEGETREAEIAWQVAGLTGEQRAALARLPRVGSVGKGVLGPGLLSKGFLGDVVSELQDRIGS